MKTVEKPRIGYPEYMKMKEQKARKTKNYNSAFESAMGNSKLQRDGVQEKQKGQGINFKKRGAKQIEKAADKEDIKTEEEIKSEEEINEIKKSKWVKCDICQKILKRKWNLD